jgi:CDP-ribitol ribitolphosphotransferase
VCKGKKVVLFAPTFRGSGNKTAYYPEKAFPVEEIMKVLPEDIVLIIKHHPFVHNRFVTDFPGGERVLDLSERENINDLLMLTNLLVTDYSSVIFEAVLLQLPILFYVFDLREYLESRDLYFDFASFAPGRIVESLETLKKILPEEIKNDCQDLEENEKRKDFRTLFLDSLDGRSTERTMELIHTLLSK